MFNLPLRRALLFIFLLSCAAAAQMLSIPTATSRFGDLSPLDAMQASQMDFSLFQIGTRNPQGTPLQSPSGSVSKLDLKASGKARREYQQGYRLLMRKDLQGAVGHLTKSTAIYPSFVAAHNALGSAYLSLGQNEQARNEFALAIALDDHLPNSYLNLGCAELSLKQYPAAEESLRKASSIAPLDVQLQMALAYGEFVNHDYSAVLATARQVHEGKHEGAAVVHYFAAGAWGAQDNLSESQHEMETLLREDPKSASASQFRQLLSQIKAEQVRRAKAKLHPAEKVTFAFSAAAGPTSEEALGQAQQVLQDIKTRNQIAEAEAEPDPTVSVASSVSSNSVSRLKRPGNNSSGATFRATVDEVALFFAATDHGKSVTNLTASDIAVRDDSRPPDAILGFRNESQLPLRLGLVIDTSNSVTDRLPFEQAAATKFLQMVVIDKNDLAFVIGVNNSVLVVQDFSTDQTLTSRAVNQLAPGGGTALWDAVAFAADKLANRPEVQPVARVLVVISDGEDNSSRVTLKQAIAHAQGSEVAVYTVSTRDEFVGVRRGFLGDHALKTLSELTGGAAFVPGSVKHLNGSFADLQQVIRGRYLVSYKPASFQRDGRYRTVDVTAQKDGHPLKVFARRGYYASAVPPRAGDR
jgi:Ca-activated chloride channel family protein